MKIAIIGDSSMLYMPYISSYEKLFVKSKVNYTLINWDRFQTEDNDGFKYRDKKIGHRRNCYDYLKYSKFIKKKLSEEKYDKLIVCGLPIACFLKKYLLKNYKEKYIIDIRDYHKILKFTSISKLVDNSMFTVISSEGYKIWLPEGGKYIINHNTQMSSIDELRPINLEFENEQINISYIGALTNYVVNVDFINSLKNKERFNLLFYGNGTINEDIEKYVIHNNINNVSVYGRYQKHEELEIYSNAHLVNMFLHSNSINNRTCLSNRLYNAILSGKPLLALDGTYLSKIIKKYNLGLVLDSFNDTEEKIKNYIKKFNKNEYNKGRINFSEEVIKDNNCFGVNLERFINS